MVNSQTKHATLLHWMCRYPESVKRHYKYLKEGFKGNPRCLGFIEELVNDNHSKELKRLIELAN